jgi:hypothetical protein
MLMGAIGLLGYNFQVTLPALARDAFGADAAGFGLMSGAIGAGSLVSALQTAARTPPGPSSLLWRGGALMAVLCAVALAPTLTIAAVLLAVLGWLHIRYVLGTTALLQTHTDPALRGRVFGIHTVLFLGSTTLGGPLTGRLIEAWGSRAGVAAEALLALGATLAAAVWWQRKGRGEDCAQSAASASPTRR